MNYGLWKRTYLYQLHIGQYAQTLDPDDLCLRASTAIDAFIPHYGFKSDIMKKRIPDPCTMLRFETFCRKGTFEQLGHTLTL